MDSGLDVRKRLMELSEKAVRENRYVFTDFLSISQLSVYYEMERQFKNSGSYAFGGIPECERCVVRFGSEQELGYEQPFPIALLKISPVNKKFTDKLTHRDYLGSIIGLGLEREKLGDIIVVDTSAYIFVIDAVAEYIIQNLLYVKHTHVNVELCDECPENLRPELAEENIIISSNRIDAVIAAVFNMSRNVADKTISEGKVFVNGIQISKDTRTLKEGEIVSVRGKGRFIFDGEEGITRKERLYVRIRRYV